MYYADSTMGSAPQLQTTAAGAMTDLLDALLVNGFGSYTAPGWAIAFTATNKRSYRAATGHRFYLNVDDTDTYKSNVRGFEAMTSTTAGTNAFPTTAQLADGSSIWYKAISDLTASGIVWWFFGSATFFYLIVQDTLGAYCFTYFFGDFPSVKTDSYNTLIGGVQSNATNSALTVSNYLNAAGTTASATIFMARSFDGTENSVGLYPISTLAARGSAFGKDASASITQSQTDQSYASAVYLGTASDATWNYSLIGTMPNLWNAMSFGDAGTSTFGDYAIDTAYNASAKFHIFYDYYLGFFMIEESTVGDL